MIDIENEVYTAVRTNLITKYGATNIDTTSEYIARPKFFPCAYLHMADNFSLSINGSNVEEFSGITYEAEVYCNDAFGKQSKAKEIMNVIDETLVPMGFTRTMLQWLPNLYDASVCRLMARYTATVDYNKTIFRR